MSGSNPLDQLGNQLGCILKVAVHYNNDLPTAEPEASRDRCMLAEIPGEAYGPDGVLVRESRCDRPGCIGGGIIDNDDFEQIGSERRN